MGAMHGCTTCKRALLLDGDDAWALGPGELFETALSTAGVPRAAPRPENLGYSCPRARLVDPAADDPGQRCA
jgi:hypothetical protein